jgi:hypothetical protein
MEEAPIAWADYVFITSLLLFLAVVVCGVVMGLKKKATIYRNYTDLFIVFLASLAPVGFYYLGMLAASPEQKSAGQFVVYLFVAVEAGLLLWIFWRTLQDNGNFFLALLAFLTKVPLAVLFIFNLIAFIAPTGKTASDRASSRRVGLIVLMLVAPLVLALVREQEGLFNLKRTLARRGIGV